MASFYSKRGDIVQYLLTNIFNLFPYPCFWEGGPKPDLNTPGPAFFYVSVTLDHTEQRSIELNPLDCYYGSIMVSIYTREGLDPVLTASFSDVLFDNLKHKYIGNVSVKGPHTVKPTTIKGWYAVTWVFPFQYTE